MLSTFSLCGSKKKRIKIEFVKYEIEAKFGPNLFWSWNANKTHWQQLNGPANETESHNI